MVHGRRQHSLLIEQPRQRHAAHAAAGLKRKSRLDENDFIAGTEIR